MSKFIVDGGHKLKGTVRAQGSKNAVFPVLAAAILADRPCTIENVPDIGDARNFMEILKFLGVEIEFANRAVRIDCSQMRNLDLPQKLMAKLRGSIVIVGALLARFGQVKFAYPGGDVIGGRPIDIHLEGFKKLGARVVQNKSHIHVAADKLKGNLLVLPIASVTGTENLILASILAEGVTEIRLAAIEPHVQTLCNFLRAMGAVIDGIGTPNLTITGVKKLAGADFSLNSDEIETVTFCAAAAATHGEVMIEGVDLGNLDAPLAMLQNMGVRFDTGVGPGGEWILIKKPTKPYRGTKIITGVFPHLLTDEQPLFGVLATQAKGETFIHDWIYEGRQGYLKILKKMGAKIEFEDIHRAKIYGPRKLLGAEIKTPDIRAGASILIAALIAKGQSVLYNAEIIDRGYERLDERLNALGARIKRVD